MNALAFVDLVVVLLVVTGAAGFVVWKVGGRARPRAQTAKLGGTLAKAMAKRR